jgi:hypothetical protein
VTFSSDFDSGNLKDVEVSPYDPVTQKRQDLDFILEDFQISAFDLYVSGDASDQIDEDVYRTWFHFSVQGYGNFERVTFTLKNPSKYLKMCNAGFKPLFAVETPEARKKGARLNWE